MSFYFRESYIVPNWDAPEALRTRLCSCGHEIAGPGYCCNGLKRGARRLAIWQYTLKGRGRIRIGDRERDVLPGWCFLAQVPEDHCYYLPDGQDSWEFIFVTLGGEEPAALTAELRRARGSVFPVSGDSAVVAAARKIIGDGRMNLLGDRYRTSSLAYDFMMRLFQSEDAGDGEARSEDGFLARIRNYCANHISEPLDVDDLARVAGCSRWHFSRVFKRAAGKSPHAFVVEMKMNYALRLLQTSGDPLKVVSERCGFNDASYFCKVFKSVYGITADGFRRGEIPNV